MSTSMTLSTPLELGEQQSKAWRGLMRAHAMLVKELDGELEAAHGLPLNSFEVLSYLDRAERCRMRMCDLASSILLSRSGLTRLVDRLERDGLLERVSCKHDARGSYAVLTADGRDRLRAARRTHAAAVQRYFLSYFSDDELATMNAYWERLDLGPCC